MEYRAGSMRPQRVAGHGTVILFKNSLGDTIGSGVEPLA
jgi:hypothetical protein